MRTDLPAPRTPASGREAPQAVARSGRLASTSTARPARRWARSANAAARPLDLALLRTPENLRVCRRCDQLIGLDVSDCPYCGLRQPALDGESERFGRTACIAAPRRRGPRRPLAG